MSAKQRNVSANIIHKTKQVNKTVQNRFQTVSIPFSNRFQTVSKANLSPFKIVSNCECVSCLDTLAEHGKTAQIGVGESVFLSNKDKKQEDKPNGKDTLLKRARAKHLTQNIARSLADLNSDLKKSYWNTYYCANILEQHEQKITSKYCKNRFCIVCNRIRTANLIADWMPVLKKMNEPVSLTLTIPNCKGEDLKDEIRRMKGVFEQIRNLYKKRGVTIQALRKLEVTFNPKTLLFHPHFHVIINGLDLANNILLDWMQRFPECNIKGQFIQRADDNSLFELFKYVTKFVSNKKGIYIRALDTIFTAMYGQRTFQAYGLKKEVNEDIEKLISEIYKDVEAKETTWSWIEDDWIDLKTGECLTSYKPSEQMMTLISNINTS